MANLPRLEGRVAEAGLKPAWGPHRPAWATGRSAFIEDGGVAALSRARWMRNAELPAELRNSGRAQHVLYAWGNGSRVLHVLNFYGISGANSNAAKRRENERLVRLLFSFASSLGDVPVLVAGDFNQSSLGPLADGFTDVVLAASHARGEVAPWTYACGDHSSRIDFIFANEVALAAVVDARVVTDSGLPQHRPLALTLDMERCEQWVWKMRPPKAFPLHQGSTFSKRSADELLFFATGVLLEREGAFREALAAWDVDGAYAILLEILEAFYIRACDIPPDEQKFYQGRGELRAPRRSKLAAPTAGDDGGAASHARVGLKKQLRRAEELLRLLRREAAGREPVPAGVGERNELWRALLRHGRPLRDVVWER